MNNHKDKLSKQFHFIVTSKIIKYLGTNLTKELQNLYSENYKVQLKGIKDLNKWETYHFDGLKD